MICLVNHNNSRFSETRFKKRPDSSDQQRFLFLCKSLSWAPFETGSQLSQFANGAFRWSGLTSIHLPASVTVIGEFCFSRCDLLASIAFDPASEFCRNAASLWIGLPLRETDLRGATALLDD
jgi:hypothetical protein